MKHELAFWACLIITNIWFRSKTPNFGLVWLALALLAAFVP